MEIQKIHDFVLDYLLEKKQTGFTLRKRPESKLVQGYWFLGTDDYLNVSFWDSTDWRNKTYNIFFGCNTAEQYWLELVDKEKGEKAAFFESISPILGLTRKHVKWKGEFLYSWIKEYKRSLADALKEFVTKDRPIIDALMTAQLGERKPILFPSIPETIFQKNLADIQVLRNKNDKNQIKIKPTHVQEPLWLKMLVLDNIANFKYIQINLDQQVTCIIGENGCGKSSILKTIALGLAGTDPQIIQLEHKKIQDLLRVEQVVENNLTFSPKGQITIFYNEYKNQLNYVRSKGDWVDEKGNRSNSHPIDASGSDLKATRDENFDHFNNLILGFSQSKGKNQNKITSNDIAPRVSEVAHLIYDWPDAAFEDFTEWALKIWSASTTFDLREQQSLVLKDIFEVIQKITGGIFELMPMQLGQKAIYLKTTDALNGIELSMMSQGYINVIGWVGHFMRRLWEVTSDRAKANFKKTYAICLIDEIDTYLHPKWEQKILAVLAEEFPNTQFVVTTHSPIVVANLKDNYRIYKIAKADNGQMMAFEHQKSDFNPYGASSSEVIRRLMHVQERPEPVQKLMDAYNQAITYNDFAKAADFETQLKLLIDPNDPEIIEGQASIEARKIIQDL